MQMITAGADYLVKATQIDTKGAATSFIARVGDPSLYIDRGAIDIKTRGNRVWGAPEVEVQQEMRVGKGRGALVVDARINGEGP